MPALLTLAAFNGINGANPSGGLVEDSSGNLFGTTMGGGAYGYGTVFEFQKNNGAIATLTAFNGVNGMQPNSNLIEDSSGNLFGTTYQGGAAFDYPANNGYGTVFEFQKSSGTLITLASFNISNGAYPGAGLVEDASGNLFGTTNSGGASNCGTVFEVLKDSGTATSIGSFDVNGNHPVSGLILDSNGNLFGTTPTGGTSDYGTVFEVKNGSNTISALDTFNGTNGVYPSGGLVEDSSGNLFGTTTTARTDTTHFATVFELQERSSTVSTIAIFHGNSNIPNLDLDNIGQPEGDLIEDGSGNLFGLTGVGGPFYGVVYEVQAATHVVSIVGAFGPNTETNGSAPQGRLLADSSGNLFGTTAQGGAFGWGTIFELSSAISPSVTIANPSLSNWAPNESGYSQTLTATGGTAPYAFAVTAGKLPPGLTLDSSGAITGTPSTGGDYNLAVTATDAAGLTGSQNYSINISPGALSQYVVTVPGSSTVQAGNSFLVTVQAADQFGNPVSTYSGPATATATISPTSTSSFPTTVSLNSSGLGFFLANVQTVGAYTITASGGSFTGSATPVTVIPGAAAGLAFASQPANTPTGVALPPVTVQVVDAFGNVVSGDSSDSIIISVGSGPGSFTVASTKSGTANAGQAVFNNLTLVVPGTYVLTATLPNHFVVSSAPFTVLPLQVVPGSFAGTPSGFSLQFDAPFLVNSLAPVLYGQGYGASAPAPSVIVTTDPGNLSDTASYVEGSLVVNAATNSITFVSTDTAYEANSQLNNTVSGTPVSPLLPDGTYTVIVRSTAAGDGFQALNSGGGFLDGLATGTPGSADYVTTFTVNAVATNEDVVWVPAVAEGPGQVLNAPGMNRAGGGYPIYLDDNTGNVTSVQVTLNYNPGLLTVSGASGAGFTLLGTSSPGRAVLQYSGPPLPTGAQTPIGYLTAMVPSGTVSNPTPYKAKDLLHLSGVLLNGGAIPVTTSDALHLVAYVGDADGNGAYSSNDAVLITRAALQTDSGFPAYPLVDPVIVADTDGSSFIPADAGLQANEAGVGFPATNLTTPAIPSGVHFRSIANNVDPTISIPSNLQVGPDGTLTVPVNIDDAHPAGSTGLIRGQLALTYDPQQFTVSAADVHLGSVLAAGTGWALQVSINQTTGEIDIAFSSTTPISSPVGGSLVTIDFHPIEGAAGPPEIALVAAVNPSGQQVVITELEDAQGAFTLTPTLTSSLSPGN